MSVCRHDRSIRSWSMCMSIVLPLPEYTAKFIPPKIVSKKSCRGVSIRSCGLQYEPWYWYLGHQNSCLPITPRPEFLSKMWSMIVHGLDLANTELLKLLI